MTLLAQTGLLMVMIIKPTSESHARSKITWGLMSNNIL